RPLRHRAARDLAVVDFGDDGPPGRRVLADRFGGTPHMSLHLAEGAPQRLAARCHRALEGDDLARHLEPAFVLREPAFLPRAVHRTIENPGRIVLERRFRLDDPMPHVGPPASFDPKRRRATAAPSSAQSVVTAPALFHVFISCIPIWYRGPIETE